MDIEQPHLRLVPPRHDDARQDTERGGDGPNAFGLSAYDVEATEAFANALVGRLRRTVVGGNGVMLDQPGATGCSPGHGRIHLHRPDGTQVG